jgi:glycosyltransferase involved in cell wall biosynthesis
MSGSPLALSVVLPCYNEEKNLALVLERYRAVAPAGLSWELVLVQNGSTDGSAAELDRLLARPENSFARRVDVPVNRGYGHGIAQGLRAARGEVLAFSHADMQCDPKDVFDAYAMHQAAGGGVIVKGLRRRRALSQQLLTWGMAFWASAVLGRRLWDINAQPKVFARTLLPRLEPLPDGFELDVHVLYRALRAGLALRTLPVHFGERAHGESKWAAHTLLRWRTILRVLTYILLLRFQRMP